MMLDSIFDRRPLWAVALTALLAMSVEASSAAAPQTFRILLLGNSYTAGHGGVGDLVERMAAARGITVEAIQVTGGGYTLEQHWSNAIGSRDAIAAGGWDWVVLQEQSTRPITDPELFFTYARLLDQDIRAVGAETVFFLTWAREYAPETQHALSQAYCDIAAELGASAAPVGMAFNLAGERDPAMALYQVDGSHQNDLGHYLVGAVFHRRLWDDSPIGLGHDVSPNLSVTPAEALFAQQAAADAPDECHGYVFADRFLSGDTAAWSGASP